MPDKNDKFFKILELEMGASAEDVKKAFRELSHIWHPDNHMGKSANVQNRATEKFKEISNAYQVLNDYLGAEEKERAEQERRKKEEKERKEREAYEREEAIRRKAEQEQRKRKEEEERKQREESERLKKKKREWEEKWRKEREAHEREEEIRRKTEQEQRKKEEKERKQREKSERLKKEEKIRWKAEQEEKEREKQEHRHWKEQAKKKHKEEKRKKKDTRQDSDFSWGHDIFSWALILPLLFVVFILFIWIEEWTSDDQKEAPHQVAGNIDSQIKVNKTNNNRISKSGSLSWKRIFRGEIIGKQGLTLNLQRNGNNLIGDYIDIHEMKKKNLIGKFDNKFNHDLVLEEYIDGRKTGSFYADFTTGKEIEGEYISQSKPNNKFKFKLKEINTPTTEIKIAKNESRKVKNESRKVKNESRKIAKGLKSSIERAYRNGSRVYLKKDYKKALEILKPLAEQGHYAAQYILGLMYQNGQGVLQNYKEAVKWFRLSAKQGHKNAQFKLAELYQDGQGILQNYALAHMWFNLCGSSEDKDCLESRDILAKKMTPSQIEKAKKMARDWKQKK